MAQLVKNPRAMQETWVRSLGWEDPLEEAWQTTVVFLSGESPRKRSLVGYRPWVTKSRTRLSTAKMYLSRTGIVKESPNLSYNGRRSISVLFH